MKIKKLPLNLLITVLIFSINNAPCLGAQQDFFKSSPRYEIPFSLILASFFLDKTIQNMALRNQTKSNDKLFEIDRYYGDKIITGASLLGFYGFSYLTKNERMKSLSEKAILSTAVSVIVVVGLKEITGRSRPYKNHGNLHFKPFAFKESGRSFPSGHTAVTFAISTVFADEIDNTIWKLFWYGAAVTVAAARIYKNQHWVSDVFTGGAIGFYVAKKTSEMYKNKKATPYFGMAFKNDALQFSVQVKF